MISLTRILLSAVLGITVFQAAGYGDDTSRSPSTFTAKDIAKILNPQDPHLTRQDIEMKYTIFLHRRALEDMKALYTQDREGGRVERALAGFSLHTPGPDEGYGLHVIKKWEDGPRTVYVNEHWPLRNGRLQLPDEIRVRTRVFQAHDESRGQAGSEDDFIGERFRVAWTSDDVPEFFDEPLYFRNDRQPRRVPVSNMDCVLCHNSRVPLPAPLAMPGQTRNFEAITQPWIFKAGLTEKAPGYMELIRQLNAEKPLSAAEKARLDETLLKNGVSNLAVPNILPVINSLLATSSWYSSLGGDGENNYWNSDHYGTYSFQGQILFDSLAEYEDESLGRTWWHDNQSSLQIREDASP